MDRAAADVERRRIAHDAVGVAAVHAAEVERRDLMR